MWLALQTQPRLTFSSKAIENMISEPDGIYSHFLQLHCEVELSG